LDSINYLEYNVNYKFYNIIFHNIYVKSHPVSRYINKLGGFPPSPPGKPKYDKEGFYTDEYNCKLIAYKAYYKRWKKYLKPWEEVFGCSFSFIDEPDKQYLRKKNFGLLEPLVIEAVDHPLDDIIS